MKNKIIAAMGIALVVMAILLVRGCKRTDDTQSNNTAIEQVLEKQRLDIIARYKLAADSARKLAVINGSKDEQIRRLKAQQAKDKEKLKLLGTDGNMAYIEAYLESVTPLRKMLIKGDTVIAFVPDHLVDIVDMIDSFEDSGVLIDSLESYNLSLVKEKDMLYKEIDELVLLNANCDSRIAAKDDVIRQKNEQIEQGKKDARKKARRNFFNGLGIGGVVGFFGGIFTVN